MGKRIKHIGMSLTEEENEKWHKTHEMSTKEACRAKEKTLNPFAVGGGFLASIDRRETGQLPAPIRNSRTSLKQTKAPLRAICI